MFTFYFKTVIKCTRSFGGGGCLFVFKTESIKMYENKNYIVHLFLHENMQPPPPTVIHSTYTDDRISSSRILCYRVEIRRGVWGPFKVLSGYTEDEIW